MSVRKVSILGKDTIHVGFSIIPHIAQTVLDSLTSSTYVLITDTNVGAHHGEAFKTEFQSRLQSNNVTARFLTYFISPGEQSKSREVKAVIEDFLLENACTRDTVILALGGGVIGDLVGFVAATFMRGVRFVQIPTTLLAMVDSSVGGKTAIDTPRGKNLIGAFWQPEFVFIDAAFLGTLPPREFCNGMAEVVKTAAIWNDAEFDFLESHSEEIFQAIQGINSKEPNVPAAEMLVSMIVGSVAVKAHIVTIDERETGLRNLVNFGHSIGHAIEAIVTPAILHGECVSVGMILEAELSRQLGHLSQVAIGRLTRCLRAYHLPVSINEPLFTKHPTFASLTVERILDVMRIDKKNSGTTKKIVLLSRVGATVEPRATGVPDSNIRKTLSQGVKVIPSKPAHDPVVMATPGSKSMSNRALVLAALGSGVCRLKNMLHSDDTQVMMTALAELKGAKFAWEDGGETLVVEGGSGSLFAPLPGREIYLGNAGTAARFLTTVCTLAKPTEVATQTIITGNARMKQRPIGPLVDALRANGSSLEYQESQNCLPLAITHGFKGGKIQLEASVSSQYVSSVLLCAPYADSPVTLELTGGIVISQLYIDMTIAMMADFGIKVVREVDTAGNPLNVYTIPKGTYTGPSTYVIESDASSATYPLAIAAITGSTCTVSNIGTKSLQGDARFAKDVLEPMGCKVVQTDYETTVTGPAVGTLKALGTIDMEPMTDAFLTASVLAAVATQPADSSRLTDGESDAHSTRITGIANQRVKECNRIQAMMDQLAKFGIETKELEDGLQIFGKPPSELKSGVSVYCYDDHRVAMAFSVLSALIPETIIEEKRCVEKTWPNWWDDLENKIGIKVEGVDIAPHAAATSSPKVNGIDTSLLSAVAPHKSIVLVGLRGSGKTYNGRLAARALGWKLVDADRAFEEKHGVLTEFVRTKGWPAFRAAETRLLEELLRTRSTDYIISLGGGIVETASARERLKEYAQSGGPVVYIVRDMAEVIKYLEDESNRPAYGESILDVCKRRIPWFEECSNYRLTVEDDIAPFFGKIVGRNLTSPPIIVPGKNTYFVSLTYPDVAGAVHHIDQITAGVDAVELRVDLLCSHGLQPEPSNTNVPGETYVADQVSALRGLTSLPIVYTVRTKSQGGAFPDDDYESAFKLLKLGLRMRCEFVDVELALPLHMIKELVRLKKPSTQIIASWHDWQGAMPWNSAMREKFNVASTCGDIVKLVSRAKSMAENHALGEFVISSPTTKPMITINIGGAGQLSRVLNTNFTPVSHPLLPVKAAPGQLSFADIQKALHLIGQLPEKKFYLFGSPISHSMSPLLHNTGFTELGLPHKYRLFETEEVDHDIEAVLGDPEFGGASVTIPHKLKIIPLLDTLTSDAKLIGAVNTIIPKTNPKTGERELLGDNTDWIAIRDCVLAKLDQSINREATALVIGAGGTSRAAIHALHALGVGTIYLYNRTKQTAEKVAQSFSSTYNIIILDGLDHFHAGPPLIVISTVPAPATTLKESESTNALYLKPSIFAAARGGVAVDMAYKPAITPLLQLATESGNGNSWKTVRGVELLIEQGCRQFQLWTGRAAPVSVIREAVLRSYDG